MADENIIQNDKQLDLGVRALASVEEAETRPVPTPLEEVESSLSDFVQKAFGVAIGSTKLQDALERDFIENLDEMKTDEKIALFNIERTTANDRLFKLLSPTFGLMTAKQHAEIQASAKQEAQAAAVQVNVTSGTGSQADAVLSDATPANVKSGLNTLYMLAQAMQQKEAAKDGEDKD